MYFVHNKIHIIYEKSSLPFGKRNTSSCDAQCTCNMVKGWEVKRFTMYAYETHAGTMPCVKLYPFHTPVEQAPEGAQTRMHTPIACTSAPGLAGVAIVAVPRDRLQTTDY